MKIRVANKILMNEYQHQESGGRDGLVYRRSTSERAWRRVRLRIKISGYIEGDECPQCQYGQLWMAPPSCRPSRVPGDSPVIYCECCKWLTHKKINWRLIQSKTEGSK